MTLDLQQYLQNMKALRYIKYEFPAYTNYMTWFTYI